MHLKILSFLIFTSSFWLSLSRDKYILLLNWVAVHNFIWAKKKIIESKDFSTNALSEQKYSIFSAQNF